MTALDTIKSLNSKLKLFTDLDVQCVARELEAEPEMGPLKGMSVGLKANIASRTAVWSAGLAHRADVRAKADANVTARLRAAGATVLPGLNMDAAALGGTTQNPHFGATLNPRNTAFSAGGSSGGSAAAVASGLVDAALGTDTLGSIRIPASYCGVYGLKPTFGAIGRTGIVPLAESFDTVGPIAKKASDLWTILQALAGEDPKDADSRPGPEGWITQSPNGNLSGLRIGVRADDDVVCAPEIREAFTRAVQSLHAAGATIIRVKMPDWRSATLRKAAFLLTECEGASVYAEELAAGDVLPATVQSLLSYGRDAGTGKLVFALAEMRRAKAQLSRTFSDVDLLITATTPQPAIRLDALAPANQADYTALANVCGVPALAAPISGPSDGLPASIQIIGPEWSEAQLVSVALALDVAFS